MPYSFLAEVAGANLHLQYTPTGYGCELGCSKRECQQGPLDGFCISTITLHMTTIDQRDLDICAVQTSEEWEVLSVRSTPQVRPLANDHFRHSILQSIYPDCVSRDSLNGGLKLEIPVEPQNPINVFITAGGSGEIQEHHLSLSSLPPVLLKVVLPPAYPLHAAPEISSFHVTGSWIPHIGLVLKSLLEMWHPGEAILYTWVEWIRSAEFLNSLQLMHNDVLRYVVEGCAGQSK